MDSACRDSLLSRVRDLKPLGASEVALYSVELARSLRASERDKLLQTLRVLVGRRIETGWQSTLVLDWVHRDCNVGDWDRPTLFVVSHRMSGRISYSVMSGLYVDRRDALEVARRLSSEFHTPSRVVPVRLTGSLLRSAFPPV